MNNPIEIVIPPSSFHIKYNYDVNPENPETDLFKTGSNCQIFAYELLRLNGKRVPNLWSDQMWNDTEYSTTVFDGKYQPLDLLFFNMTDKPHSAHVGVYIGENQVIYNSKQVGHVSIWTLDDFAGTDRYKVILGGKRIKNI